MCETPSAEGLDALNLLSLPEDLIISIASLLEDRDVYGLEFTSKRLYTALTMSCRTWPNERQLDLGARFGVSTPSPEALRSLTMYTPAWIFQRVEFSVNNSVIAHLHRYRCYGRISAGGFRSISGGTSASSATTAMQACFTSCTNPTGSQRKHLHCLSHWQPVPLQLS